jgi:hypothetical protein
MKAKKVCLSTIYVILMSQDSDKDVVSIGMKNLDVLLDTDGIPVGTVGTLVSNPQSSGYRLLLNMLMDQPEEAAILSNNRDSEDILGDIGTKFQGDTTPAVSQIHGNDIDEVIDEIMQLEYEDLSVIIIDSIEGVSGINDSQKISSLRRLASEAEFTVLMHYIEQPKDNIFPFDLSEVIYTSDFVFALMKKRLEQSIRQQFVFHRLPAGCGVDTNQIDIPLVEVEFISRSLAVDSGERI